MAVYIGTITLSSVFLAAIGVLVWRRPALRREGVAAEDVVPLTVLVNVGAFLVALALGTALPRVNYYALLLLFLSGPVDRLLVSRKPGRKPGRPSGEDDEPSVVERDGSGPLDPGRSQG